MRIRSARWPSPFRPPVKSGSVMRSAARVGVIVQARLSSTRLPGKVLADICGQPALLLLLERLLHAGEPDLIAVATSEKPDDDALVEAVEGAGVSVVRGPLDDVLERYRLASAALDCDGIVRITADCPLIDPAVVDRVVARWRSGDEDYVANVLEPRTFPIGQDTEAISRTALDAAAAEASKPYDREHVTPYVRSRPERFPQAPVTLDPPLGTLRLVLDTPEDLERLRALTAACGPAASMDELAARAQELLPNTQ
jgi:spore coat polysaccharide biosynthesis protein SpsF